MPENRNNEPMTESHKQRLGINRLLLTIGVGLLIFVAGYGLGSGTVKLNFGRSHSVNQQLPDDLDFTSVEQLYDSLKENYAGQLDINALMDGLKKGLARASGDPYTEYLNQEEAQQFGDELSGKFTGIGAELSKDEHFVTVVAPLAGFPAEKAGLRPKDVIIKINDESTYDLSLSEAVNKIRGPAGSEVKLTVLRNQTEELTLAITRAEITIPSVESRIMDGNIGYLKVSRFGEDTDRLSREAAAQFKRDGVKGVVLDLRSNPGGLLDASVDLASLWLNKDEIVLEEKRDGEVVKTYRAEGSPLLNGIPTVVLIDEGSASASEITAGALKDHGLATLIGTKTYGKGSVQRLVSFGDGTQLKVTIARWFTPKGRNIDQEGIEPDEKVEISEQDFEDNRDPQLDAALESLNK